MVTLVLAGAAGGFGLAVGLVGVLRAANFYFTFFESRWKGATPGKRALRLRVVDAHGGPLDGRGRVRAQPDARDRVLRAAGGAAGAWQPGRLAAALGARGLAGLAAGVRAAAALQPRSPAAGRPGRRHPGGARAARGAARGPQRRHRVAAGRRRRRPRTASRASSSTSTASTSCRCSRSCCAARAPSAGSRCARCRRRVQAKLRWQPPVPDHDAERFLHDFYTAQRRRLEQKMLLGHRQERKRGRYSKTLTSSSRPTPSRFMRSSW